MSTPSPRGPRADAERNRLRIINAAARVFAERGSETGLNHIARAAGVGVGTVYRNFSDKDAILDVLLDEKIDALVELADAAAKVEDAGAAVRDLMFGVMTMRASDRGLDAVLAGPARRSRFSAALEERFVPLARALVEQAIAAGELRPDFRAEEICLLGYMVGAVADITRDSDPGVWERYARLILDGTRPGTHNVPLAPAALSFADSMTALGRAG